MKRSYLVPALCLLTLPAIAADLAVDFSKTFKPVDHAASGSLYGIAAEGWPADDWIAGISAKNFVQMAPGGRQLPNGETAPVGDALIVAPIAARHGASVTVRMPDFFPSFPYIWQGDEFWTAAVDRMVRAVVAADPPNIYAYEIWNEPDWNWKPEWGDFDAMWARTYRQIRDIDATRRIMGPSASKWDVAWMHRFLANAITSGTVPQVVSWHELEPAAEGAVGTHVAAYRALEKQLGIGPLPISINEYGAVRDSAVPGALTRMIARLERAGVDTADLAFWHRPGRLADLLTPAGGGTGPARDARPTGAYWLYQWYGQMAGRMASVTPTDGSGRTLDGFASVDPGTRTARIILGGEDGNHQVTVAGLRQFGATVTAQVFAARWSGTDGASPGPEALFQQDIATGAGPATIAIDGARASDAYLIVLTPPELAARFNPSPNTFSVRLEAEDAQRTGARPFPISMALSNFFANMVSGKGYVGLLDRRETWLQFAVKVPQAGRYRLRVSYSNGLPAAAIYQVAINRGTAVRVVFPPTQGRELFGQVEVAVDLAAGDNEIRLEAGPESPKGSLLPSLLEVDYLDVIAAP
jgi:hypothetical protein